VVLRLVVVALVAEDGPSSGSLEIRTD